MTDKIMTLAKKLKALAERGVGGEKNNAITILENLCKTHGIAMEEIDREGMKHYRITYRRYTKRMLLQIIVHVTGRRKYSQFYHPGNREKNMIEIECTPSEYIEIEAKFKFYSDEYRRQLKTFYHAFIATNNLYTKHTETDGEETELSPEEKEHLERVRQLMLGMSPAPFHTQLPEH